MLTVVCLSLRIAVYAQEHLPNQSASMNPELKVNELSTESDDWVYSTDGRTLAYSSLLAGVTQVVDTASKRTIASLPVRGMLAIAEDGASVAIGTQKGEVLIWNARGYWPLPQKHELQISSLAMTPDGRWLVSGDAGGVVSFWDLTSQRLVWSIDLLDRIQSLALSADASRVLVCWGSGALALPSSKQAGSQILDGQTGKALKTLDGKEGYGVIAGALSSDGSVAVTVRDFMRGVSLWDAQSGQLKSVLLDRHTIARLSLSEDGTKLAAVDDFKQLTLVHTQTRTEITKLAPSSLPGNIKKLQFIHQGDHLAAAIEGYGAVILATEDAHIVETLSESRALPVPIGSATASSSGSLVLGSGNHLTVLWDLEQGGVRFRYGSGETAKNIIRIPLPSSTPRSCDLEAAVIAPDGSAIAAVSCLQTIVFFDPSQYGKVTELKGMTDRGWNHVGILQFSPTARYLVASVRTGSDKKLLIWDRKTESLQQFPLDNKKLVTSAGFDDGEHYLWLVLGRDPVQSFFGSDFLRVDLSDGSIKVVAHFENTVCDWASCGLDGMRVAPGGHLVAYNNVSGENHLKDLDGNRDELLKEDHRGGSPFTPAFSCDGKLLLYGNRFGGFNLYDIESRTVVWNKSVEELLGFSPRHGTEVSFSCDDGLFVLADTRLFRITGDLRARIAAPTIEYKTSLGEIGSFSEVTSKHFVVAATSIGINIFDVPSGKLLATLITLNDGPWVVTSPAGQFDTDDPEGLDSLSWIMNDDQLRPLPIDIFMRDYYEPRLLPRLLAGDTFKVRPVASLNRVQPLVALEQAEWQDAVNGIAKITVKVSRNTDKFPRENRMVEISTGVYDLRVFRDGQMVAWAPQTAMDWQLEAPPADREEEVDLQHWRQKTEVKLEEDGTKHLQFLVQIPRNLDLKRVKRVGFTAYAFNEDRVKSATATRFLDIDPGLKPRIGRAYIISVGVNRTESSPAWDLRYAANDARRMTEVVGSKVEATKQFKEVVRIRLVSDVSKKKKPDEAAATKVHVHALLDLLAGRPLNERLKSEIPGVNKIEQAHPEDLVLLTFSSHGYTDERGAFHIVLADVGRNTPQDRISPKLQRNSLSSDELSAWLRAVDAGQVAMVVDSCHSEASIRAEGFKPGPMGSRGLGQLAYDKGMRILAASKSEQSAVERGGLIKDGLLTYALIREGLEMGEADFRPVDGKILLSEWLDYAAQEVPTLFREGDARGTIHRKGQPQENRDAYHGANQTPEAYQQPVLFDFTKGRREIVISVK